MKTKKQTGRIQLPKGKTANDRAKEKATFRLPKNAGLLERLLHRQRGLTSVEQILQHCKMCGADASHFLEPGFTPDGKAEILCQDCRIGSAESLGSRRHAVTSKELATVLASLRHWQRTIGDTGAKAYPDHFAMSGEKPLTLDQVDALCERLNVGVVHADYKPTHYFDGEGRLVKTL